MKSVEPTDSISVAINDDIEEKSVSRRPLPQYSICRVPEWICSSDPDAYKPQVVSIGPYHHGAQGLEAMEKCKRRFLAQIQDMGNRNGKPHVLKECREELKRMENEARECYAGDLTMTIDREHLITETTVREGDNPLKKIEKGDLTAGNLTIKNLTVKTERGELITMKFDRGELPMSSHKFVEILLLDGCFVIGLLSEDNGLVNDPVFKNQWAMMRVAIDMLLLENQFPLLVLEALYGILCHVMKPEQDVLLLQRSREFFQKRLNRMFSLRKKGTDKPAHLLHFIHSLIPSDPAKNDKPKFSLLRWLSFLFIDFVSKFSTASDSVRISTATELCGAGVEFERFKIEGESFLDVKFDKGRMKMGQLLVDDRTNRIFRNFIAFEQCLPNDDPSLVFSSYCRFIDSLVNTAKDVKILKECGVIYSLMGSNEEVAALFNKLCDGLRIELGVTLHLKKAKDDAREYSKKRWPKWRAKFVGDYFSNPWATISLIAATLLFVIGVMQFVYSNLKFYEG